MNIYIVGMPGAGKSSIGRRAAKLMGKAYFDLDEEISKEQSIDSLFEQGEDVFRKKETEVLRRLSDSKNRIIITGGGAVTVPENIEIMKRTGKIVFLDRSPELIKNGSLKGRPLIAGDKNRIDRLYEERINLYRGCADTTIKNEGSFISACNALADAVKQLERQK